MNTAQQVTDAFSWWPYGDSLSRSGANPTPFGFVGGYGYYTDTDGIRQYVGARSYRPSWSAWQQSDPLWPDVLTFAYADTNPTSLVDDDGLQTSGYAHCAPPVYPSPWPRDLPWPYGSGPRGPLVFPMPRVRTFPKVPKRRNWPRWRRLGQQPNIPNCLAGLNMWPRLWNWLKGFVEQHVSRLLCSVQTMGHRYLVRAGLCLLA